MKGRGTTVHVVAAKPGACPCKTRRANPSGKRLTTKARDKMPKSSFADIAQKRYPIRDAQGKPDPRHIGPAIAYIERDYKAKRLSKAERDKFRARADAAESEYQALKTPKTDALAALAAYLGAAESEYQALKTPKGKQAAPKKAPKAKSAPKAKAKKRSAKPKAAPAPKAPKSAAKQASGPSPAKQEKVPMARKAGKARKGTGKKRRTAAQKAATKRMLAANRAIRKVTKASGMTGGGGPPAKAKARKAKARKATAPKATARMATRRTSSGPTIVEQLVVRERAVSKPPKAKAPKAAKPRARARAASRAVTYVGTAKVRTHRRGGNRRNPVGTTGRVFLAMGMIPLGYLAFTVGDRFFATRNAYNTADSTNPLYGTSAWVAVRDTPNVYRVLIPFGGGALLAIPAFLVRRKHPLVTAIVGGLAGGAFMKFLTLGGEYLIHNAIAALPATANEQTLMNRLFPEKMKGTYTDPTTGAIYAYDAIPAKTTTAGATAALPPWRRAAAPTAPAGGAVGRCPGCGQVHGLSPKAQSPSARSASASGQFVPGTVTEVSDRKPSAASSRASHLRLISDEEIVNKYVG